MNWTSPDNGALLFVKEGKPVLMFWPVTLVMAIVLSALVMTGAVDNLSAEAQFTLAFCVCVLAASVSVARGFIRTGRFQIGPVIWSVTALTLATGYAYREHGRLFALSLLEQPVVELERPATLPTEVMLMRAWDGHFRAVADVNSTPVGLLIDTGASLVLLRHDDAMRIGIRSHELDFTMAVTTANGRSFVAPYMFEEISIGGIIVRNIAGAVAQEDQLHTSLLGMSFIEQLDEAAIRSDRIILRN